MKREIKYRAFQDNQMLESPISSNYGLQRFFGFLYEDTPIMQYTGLNDAEINGNEVYEGDIIENCDTKNLQLVYWNEDKAAWYCRYFNDETHIVSLSESIGNLNKVIGNIYQNADLLQFAF